MESATGRVCRGTHQADDGYRRVSPIAVRPGEGPLTEPTADARACRWEPVKMPQFGIAGAV
jgi:hypothetical protein